MSTTTPSRLHAFRERRDDHYRSSPDSPLAAEQRAGFSGLKYFAERPDLALELDIDTSDPDVGEHIEMPASDGSVKHFIRAGRLQFTIDGKPARLAIFKDVARGRYFLPFRDGTSGQESYGAGRYLDPKARPDGRLVVDFNYAYNPYCAYGEGWSCPIPPLENFLKVRIEAGEQAYKPESSADESS